MKYVWNVKTRPEDFIVIEKAYFKEVGGEFNLYLLIKRNLSTLEIAKKLELSYAGLKDKVGITFQYVSSKKDYGSLKKEKFKDGSFFILKKLGKIKRKIKIGQLEGNFFDIKLPKKPNFIQNVFINYFDTQRVKLSNLKLGKKLLTINKKLSAKENLIIDAYLSYLWNKSLEKFLLENLKLGVFLEENKINFFIPKDIHIENLPKFWPILGYKVKLENSIDFYEFILKEEGFSLEEFIQILKLKKIKGDYRRTYEKVSNLKVYDNRIRFFLKKGAYATMYIKHLYTKNCIFSIK